MAASIVQYVVIRRDLLTKLNWPLGAVIAQACHASSAAIHIFYADRNTQEYLKDLDQMHKVILEAEDEEALHALSQSLKTNSIDHKLWIEQPENIATCLVSKPYKKQDIQSYFKKFKLFK